MKPLKLLHVSERGTATLLKTGGVEVAVTSETTAGGDDLTSVENYEDARGHPATAGTSEYLLTCEYMNKGCDLHRPGRAPKRVFRHPPARRPLPAPHLNQLDELGERLPSTTASVA